MKKSFLLPYGCKKVGLVLFIISIVLFATAEIGEHTKAFDFSLSVNQIRTALGMTAIEVPSDLDTLGSFSANDDIMFTLVNILFILGSGMLGLSKLKYEDEYFTNLRLKAMVLSVYLFLALLLYAQFAYWGIAYLSFMTLSYPVPILFFLVYFYGQVAIIRRRNRREE